MQEPVSKIAVVSQQGGVLPRLLWLAGSEAFVLRFVVLAVCGCFLATLCVPCAAQTLVAPVKPEPSSSAIVHGRILDNDQRPVAGVSILLGTQGGGKKSLHSDATGNFKITVEAGDYKIWLSKHGFAPVAARPVSLHRGENRIRFVLRRGQAKGLKSVTNAMFPPDEVIGAAPKPAKQTAGDYQENLPAVSETLLDRYGEIRTPGAQLTGSKYLVDRPDQSKPQDFGLASRLNEESVQSLEVTTAKMSFSGQAPEYATADRTLTLEPKPAEDHTLWSINNLFPSPLLQRGLHLGNWKPQVTWTGPLCAGHAWFSDTIRAEHDIVVVPELPRRQDSIIGWEGSNLIRAQLSLPSNHILNASFLSSLRKDSHLGLSAFEPLSTTVDLGARRLRFSANDQHAMGQKLLEAGITLESLHSTLSPQGGTPYILFPGSSQGNYFETLRGDTQQGQIFAGLLIPTHSRLGNHDIQMGTDLGATHFTHHAERRPFQIRREDGSLEQDTVFVGNSDFSLSNTRFGSYVQDTWKLTSRLRIQSGLRVGWDRILHAYEAAPRFSVVYSPFANRRTKLFAFWGVYYPPLNLALLGQALDQLRIDKFYDPINRLTEPPQTVDFTAALPRLHAPHFSSSRTGVEQQIASQTFVSVSALWRDQRDGLAYHKLAALHNEDDLVLLNDRRDRYRAIEFSLRQSFGSKSEILASYTRSHATTNQIFDYDPASDAFTAQFKGPLGWDAPNRFFSWGWAPVRHGNFRLSYLLEYRTGFPFTVFDESYQVVGQPNLFRFPDFFRLNLGVEKLFNLRGRTLGVQFACLNATNHNNPTVVDNNIASPDFLRFAGSMGRGFTGRIRLAGKS